MRKMIFICVTPVLILLFLELTAAGILSLLDHKMFSYTGIWQQMEDLVNRSDPADPGGPRGNDTIIPAYITGFVLHPFLGYVIHGGSTVPMKYPDLKAGERKPLLMPQPPSNPSKHKNIWYDTVRNSPELADSLANYGFRELDVRVTGGALKDRFTVALMGGSVAAELGRRGLQDLIQAFRQIPELKLRELQILPLALPGYKQPQQLMTLLYFLSLGVVPDVVINLDGFNEVVLPSTDNLPKSIYPLFPRGWYYFAGGIGDRRVQAEMGRLVYLGDTVIRRTRAMRESLLRYSPTALLAWRQYARSVGDEMRRTAVTLESMETQTGGFAVRGPAGKLSMEQLADYWMQCSLLMHQVCGSNDILYIHCLQPNQYVPDTKPMSREERDETVIQGSAFQRLVTAGYPMLQARGEDLKRSGVVFKDLSGIFMDTEPAVYRDTCCHFNALGSQMIGDAIADIMARELHDQRMD